MEMDANVRREAARKDETELIHLAIEQLIAQKKSERNKRADTVDVDDDDDDELLLSKLLSQLESIKKDNTTNKLCELAEAKDKSPAVGDVETNETAGGSGSESKEIGTEDIVKELREVKRQNSITHWLMSIMIVLTAAWQLSEVSLLLKVRNKVSHPFRSVGSMITGAQDVLKHFDGNEQDAARKHNHPIESPSVPVPALKLPELPCINLPVLGQNGGEN